MTERINIDHSPDLSDSKKEADKEKTSGFWIRKIESTAETLIDEVKEAVRISYTLYPRYPHYPERQLTEEEIESVREQAAQVKSKVDDKFQKIEDMALELGNYYGSDYVGGANHEEAVLQFGIELSKLKNAFDTLLGDHWDYPEHNDPRMDMIRRLEKNPQATVEEFLYRIQQLPRDKKPR